MGSSGVNRAVDATLESFVLPARDSCQSSATSARIVSKFCESEARFGI
jgi:hypothetical protein